MSNPDFVIIADDRPSGTSGGFVTSAAWNTRPMNTFRYNQQTTPSPWVSLASNQFTLQPGKYYVEVYTAGWKTSRTQLRLFNVTDSTTDILGLSSFIITTFPTNANRQMNTITIKGELNPMSTKTYRVDQYMELNGGVNSLGVEFGSTTPVTETYLLMMITKLE